MIKFLFTLLGAILTVFVLDVTDTKPVEASVSKPEPVIKAIPDKTGYYDIVCIGGVQYYELSTGGSYASTAPVFKDIGAGLLPVRCNDEG